MLEAIMSEEESRKSRVETRETNRNEKNKEIREWIVSIVIAVVLALLIRTFLFEFIRVDGPSMEPTLYTGYQVMINKVEYRLHPPERGDIIVCQYPGRTANYVKRIVAVENQVVEVRNQKVYIDGKPVEEKYIKEPIFENTVAVKVPAGSVFVMGDNRNDSMDSRDATIGPISRTMILGKADGIIWPFQAFRWFPKIF
jgi:signal peptidase I